MSADEFTRIPATELFPVVEEGRVPAKAAVGDPFPIRATVFREGLGAFGAQVVLTDPEGRDASRTPLRETAPGIDRLEAWVQCERPGDWRFRVETWADPYATWTHDARIKIHADEDVELMLLEGSVLLRRAAEGRAQRNPAQTPPPAAQRRALMHAAHRLADQTLPVDARLAAGTAREIADVFAAHPLRDLYGRTRSYPLQVERARAVSGSWYELFPRSQGARRNPDGSWVSGTLRTTADGLDRVAGMGFDVLYLTPIHPVGHAFRKGPDNALDAGPNDPGSPWAIGDADGGHDAINPELGTFEDFDALVARAHALGMEVALDFALQCSPDHPWVRKHPEWFTTRADGSIAYAENPPKKYQDIYPLNFDNDPDGLLEAIVGLLELWIAHGVTIFRVDNPHTKPIPFWHRLLARMHRDHPDVVFLAEAFTRPAIMRTLGMAGFQQSYTYFAWRTEKQELLDYFTEVSRTTAHLMRPTFFPTTPDILTEQMSTGGPTIFKIRAVLATASPNWGIYSGYECAEGEQRPGVEEFAHNEKYEYRPRDWKAAEGLGIAALLAKLNAARHAHPALRQLHRLDVHPTTGDKLVCFSKHVPARFSPTGRDDTVIVVASLDPHGVVEGSVDLDVARLGPDLPAGANPKDLRLSLLDELDGRNYVWGVHNYVRFSPDTRIAHVFSLRSLSGEPAAH